MSQLQALQRFSGLKLFGVQADDMLATHLVEAEVPHDSALPGRTLQEVDLRSMFNAGGVGIRRGGKRREGQLGQIPLRVGDRLLMAVGRDFHQHRNLDRNFPGRLGYCADLRRRPHVLHDGCGLWGSACFLIPYGDQAHLMVYSPGRYGLGDFLRVEWSVSLVYSVAVLSLTSIV